MRLFQRRRRDAERAGKPPELAEAIPIEARVKIGHALGDHAPPATQYASFGYGVNVTDWMLLNEQLGWVLTRAWGIASFKADDVRSALADASDPQVLDMIEAWYQAAGRLVRKVDEGSGVVYSGGSPMAHATGAAGGAFRERINDVFDEHDIAWQLVGDHVVPRSSIAMHATVVEPVFALTQGDSRFSAVERAYQDALSELKPGGNPSDAITDAGTAVQEALRALGLKGDQLGTLLTEARKRELLAPYDSKLAEAINLIGDWVGADRGQRGDTHVASEASRDDAWLAVRVAGALILRLTTGQRR